MTTPALCPKIFFSEEYKAIFLFSFPFYTAFNDLSKEQGTKAIASMSNINDCCPIRSSWKSRTSFYCVYFRPVNSCLSNLKNLSLFYSLVFSKILKYFKIFQEIAIVWDHNRFHELDEILWDSKGFWDVLINEEYERFPLSDFSEFLVLSTDMNCRLSQRDSIQKFHRDSNRI